MQNSHRLPAKRYPSLVDQDNPTPSPAAPALSIALVEDEPDLREGLTRAFEREGLKVHPFADGDAAWSHFEDTLPDLVVLDIMLPGIDGLELCRRLRARSESLPILFLTSRDEEFDRVLGLELGADDYLCKPFSLRELIARVRVLVRRLRLLQDQGRPASVGRKASDAGLAGQCPAASEGSLAAALLRGEQDDPEAPIRQGPLCLDQLRYQALWNQRDLRLTITEFRLLRSLACRPGHVRSRAQLLVDAYPEDRYKSDRTIDTHIKRLRKKIEAASAKAGDGEEGAEAVDGATVVETLYGVGYRFTERWQQAPSTSQLAG